MILESSHQAVCDALHRAIIERDQLKADIAATRTKDARLRELVREVLDSDKGTIDPPTVREIEEILGGGQGT